MGAFRKISDWYKYEQLHHYPALAAFDKELAIKRLKAYEKEERKACEPWLSAVLGGGLVLSFALIWAVYYNRMLVVLIPLIQIPTWLTQYTMYRRIQRRVEAKVLAELRDGRLWECVECGYDLRASEDRCPECGAPVRVGPLAGETAK